MSAFRFGLNCLAVATLVGVCAPVVSAAVTVEQILGYKPKQPGVEVTVPLTGDVTGCTLELEKGQMLAGGKQATAWVVKDAKGVILRKFHDTTGGGGVNMFAYYRDGEEVYRDIANEKTKLVDQFRWLGSAGSKWGIDLNGDEKIDSWLVISPEELSQELLAAIVTKDVRRLQALMLTNAELAAIGLPPADAARVQAKLAGAAAQFQKTCKELAGLTEKTIWIQLQTRPPQTIAAESLGAKADLVHYKHATILTQDGEGMNAKHNWIQTGEMIQVGKAWRIVQGPAAGMQPPPDEHANVGINGPGVPIPTGAEKLIEALDKLDKDGPGQGKAGLIAFNLKRAGILEQIAALYTKAEDRAKRDVWLRQVADSLAAAAQQGDKAAQTRIGAWREALTKDPTGPALAYFAFREISANYAQQLPGATTQEALNKLQESWKANLTKYANDFPSSEDTPDAILQLGMVNEYFGAKTEGEAKAAYSLLIKNFPTHALARRAQGCLDRLSLEGTELDLTAPNLNGGAAFDVKALKGKAAVVYYWASWNDLAASDFNKIKLAMKDFAGKAELVGVNLDNKAADATAFLRVNPIDGTQLFMPGGLDSPLAVRYGITALPVMLLVGPDGKVVSRQVQASTLDDELKKLFKVPEKDK
jgi:hypothetical protein